MVKLDYSYVLVFEVSTEVEFLYNIWGGFPSKLSEY